MGSNERIVSAIGVPIELGVRHPKKSLDFAELNQSQKRQMVEALHTDYSVRYICDVLGFNRSSLYYQPKPDPIELSYEMKLGNWQRVIQNMAIGVSPSCCCEWDALSVTDASPD